MTNYSTPNIVNPFQQHQIAKTTTARVGQGQDFELFGRATTSNFGQLQPQSQSQSMMDYSTASLPDLIPDQGSPSSSASAVSSQRIDSPPLQQPSSSSRQSLHRPSLQSLNSDRSNGGSYRGEGRASSVPPPEFPRPMRRKTQENHHWPSFVSSNGSTSSSSTSSSQYLPTPQQLPQHNLPYVDEPSSYTLPPSSASNSTFDPASLSLSPAQYPYAYQAPHTDHPLLPSEQSDLLDRVRRDLLDVDLSSIKGPLRALALSGGGGSDGGEGYTMMSSLPSFNDYRASLPSTIAADRDKTPTPNYHRSPPSTRSPAIAALQHSSEIGTVSPQEAFLDYPAVDSKLHDLGEKDGKLARSDFGVGVGHSLFAPLPTSIPLHPSQVPTSKNKIKPTNSKSSTTSLQNAFPAVTTTVNSISSRSPTPQQSTSSVPPTPASQSLKTSRNPHPFSVPQNAVSWATRRSNSGRHLVGGIVDGDVDDEDGDFGEPSSSTEVTAGEEEEEYLLDGVRRRAGLPQGFGRFDRKELGLEGLNSEVERARYGTEREGELINSRPIKEENGRMYGVPQPQEEEQEQEQAFSFIPPPPLTSRKQQFEDPPPTFASPKKSFLFSSNSQHPTPIAPAPSSHGTSTPRRAAAANALAGLQAQSSNSSLDEPNSAPSNSATTSTAANRSKRQRKRSRLALEEDEDDDEYREEGDGGEEEEDAEIEKGDESDEYQEGGSLTRKRRTSATQDESDESYRSSSNAPTPASSARRSGGGGGTKGGSSAPKRRRRAPATEGKSSSSTSKGSISCDHVSTSTGEKCGVVFRRPYDLARHKETIHGETLGGEKLPPGKAKEWRCSECGGTFSRKDALLRHGRIRGHKPGV